MQTAAAVFDHGVWWAHPMALFVIVVVAASLCVVASVAVLYVAAAENLAELGLIGAFGMSVSALPLVHGLTVPGVLFGTNAATMSSVFWALPVGSVAMLPLLARRSRWSRVTMRRWKPFVAVHVAITVSLSAGLLARPSLLPFPAMAGRTAILCAFASLSVCLAISARQLRLAWISRSARSLAVSLGFALVGVSALVWVSRAPFSLGFWLAHVFDIVGVFLMTIGAVVTYRQRPGLGQVVRPLTVHDPLSAFELGLEPVVHQFVAALERKDTITRDHVVRTAELAMSVGQQLNLSAPDLHTLGLGALLHDVGKLTIPDEILNKPGRLDAAEFEVIRGHAAAGADLLCQSSVLARIIPIVRSHHERVDGDGYPDHLVAEQIPFLARVVSVCDAYDAMASTRQYRQGMGSDKAIAVLREHAGSQWDACVVEALVQAVIRQPPTYTAFTEVGRSCCGDALPVVVAGAAAAG
jgi:putative nucleotidyltransferase with HDIG domain